MSLDQEFSKSEQIPSFPSRHTGYKLKQKLKTILTDAEEMEFWRRAIMDEPDSKVRNQMFLEWNNRVYGKVPNNNVNLNADISPADANQSCLSQATIDAIVGDLKGNQLEHQQAIEAEFTVKQVELSSEQTDKNLTIAADLIRLRRELFADSNERNPMSEEI